MSIKLIVRWKDEDKQPQEMERIYDKDVVGIGRNIRNDFCISDRFASSYHAKIELDGKNYILRDLGSTNGTFLNGEQLQPNESKTLKNADIIKIAKVDIEFIVEKEAKKSAVSATPSMHKAAYNSLYEISKYFISKDFSFKSEKDIEAFSERLQDVIEIFCTELFSNVEIYSHLQYELDVDELETTRRKYNPIKTSNTAKEVAKFLLDSNNSDKLSTMNFLKSACHDLAVSQKVILRILESVLPTLLEKISPENIERELRSIEHDQKFLKVYVDKFLKQYHKNLWDNYVEKHRLLKENKNKRFEIIREEFQKTYPEILGEEQESE